MKFDPYRCRVKDVCSRDLVFVHADGTIHEALSLMVENRVSALPVVDKRGGCQGMLSSTDVIEFALELDDDLQDIGRAEDGSYQWLVDRLADQDMDRRSVQDLMTSAVATVDLETSLAVAAREMLRHRVHRLPVVDQKERLVGIVSTMDILGAFANGAPTA